jgi:hypothetical protein
LYAVGGQEGFGGGEREEFHRCGFVMWVAGF